MVSQLLSRINEKVYRDTEELLEGGGFAPANLILPIFMNYRFRRWYRPDRPNELGRLQSKNRNPQERFTRSVELRKRILSLGNHAVHYIAWAF